jgi:hypothetical protein
MNNRPNNGENHQSLSNDLERLGDAYNQLPHEEPPELLDQAILNSAHRAVEPKPHWMQFGWLHGLTTAAVLVLALSLIFNQREQVPDFEDGMRVNESIGLQRERAVKKQSGDVKPDDLRMEMKEENEKRQDVFQSAPVPAASQIGALKNLTDDQPAEPAAGARVSTYASEGLKAKRDSADKDETAIESVAEEVFVDEADFIADAPEIESIDRPSRPATIAASISSKAEAQADNVSEIEQKLLDIIKLKQSGDEAWITELALFKQNYPDYPLPDELSN